MSIPSTKSSRYGEKHPVFRSKISRRQRVFDKLKTLYQHMSSKNLHIDTAKDVASFYNDNIFFAHLFSSEFLNESWFTVPFIICWFPGEAILKQDKPLRDWRGKVLPVPQCDSANGDNSFEKHCWLHHWLYQMIFEDWKMNLSANLYFGRTSHYD